MIRVLTYLNLLGVCGLAVLCGFQWQANGRAAREAVAADAARTDAAARLVEQTARAATATTDLDDAKTRLAAAQAAAADANGKLAALTAERDQLAAERAHYRSVVDQWSTAIVNRDAALKRLAAERDDATHRYNGLVVRYNALAQPGH